MQMARRVIRRFFVSVTNSMWSHIRKMLAPPETKSSLVARLIALEHGGRPRWTPRAYAALAREGYARNAIVTGRCG